MIKTFINDVDNELYETILVAMYSLRLYVWQQLVLC